MALPDTLSTKPPSWFSLRDGVVIYEHGARKVWKIRNDLILKRVLADPDNSEAATHAFLRANTSLPVPRIYAEWLSSNRYFHYLLESQIPGEPLSSCWRRLPTTAKVRIATQVTTYMTRLADFTSNRMQTISGARLPDNNFTHQPPGAPYREFLRGRWSTDADIFAHEFRPALAAAGVHPSLIRALRRTMPPCVSQLALTHCDLYLGNVMVDPDRGVVTGVIDWESAGFWPAWFQYARVTHGVSGDDAQWKVMLGRLMRDGIPYAEQGRVWWDAVRVLVARPGSLLGRAWVGLLGRYVRGEGGWRR